MIIKIAYDFEIKSIIDKLATKEDVKNLLEEGKAFIDSNGFKVFVFDAQGQRVDIAYIKDVNKTSDSGSANDDPVTLRENREKKYLSISEMISTLNSYGIKTPSFSSIDDLTDGSIDIGDDDMIYIQVGSDYVTVNRWDKEKESVYHSPIFDRSYLTFITKVISMVKISEKEVSLY